MSIHKISIFSFIKQKLSILDIVKEYTTLKKAGHYWKGCCPFHHEKTASFTVSPHKEIFYCFGCHVGGDVISFISRIEHCSQLEAAQQLAERYNIAIPKDIAEHTGSDIDQKNNYLRICSVIAQWCHKQLINNTEAYKYLINRAIDPAIIKDFSLGYFPAGQQSIKNILQYCQKQGIIAQDLIKAHILLDGKRGLYSPFEDRILFPIADHLGRICGFGGRVFKANSDGPKYYNSHEHLFFNKSSLLFGLDKAKKAIQEKEIVFLVEGYTDVLAMVQYGYSNTVATLGTACTQEHLKQLSKYAQKLYIVYDGDAAGQKAIMRLLYLCWQVSIELLVIILPATEDPASFLTKKGDMQTLIDEAQDIFIFFIQYISSDFSTKSLQERLQATKQLIAIIRQLQDPLKQDLLLQKAATALDIPFATLQQELKRNTEQSSIKIEQEVLKAPEHKQQAPEISQLEKKLFSAILSYKGILEADDEKLLKIWLAEQLRPLFSKILEARQKNSIQDSAVTLDIFTDQEKQFISRLIIEAEEDNAVYSFKQLLLLFYKKQWKIVVQNVKLKIKRAEKMGTHESITYMLEKFELLKKKMLQRGIS